MKMIKNDSRYIIKKIIIGVGIALILSFLKTNNVFALEKNVYMDLSWTGSGSDGSYLSYNSLNLSNNDKIFDFEFFSSNLTKWNFQTYAMYGQVEPKYYIVYYNSQLNAYYYDLYYGLTGWLGNITLDLQTLNCVPPDGVGTHYYCSFENNTNLSDNNFEIGIRNSSFFLSDSSILSSLENYSSDLIQYQNNTLDNQNDFDINLYYTGRTNAFITSQQFFTDFKIISTNIPNIYVDGTKLEVQPNLPSDYSEINLTGSEGVYFVPKNYNQVPIEHIDSTDYIDFDYYYQGNIKEGWFPINNVDKMFFSDLVFSSSSLELRDSFFPMYEDPNNTATGYNYYAYMIFNNSQENSTIYYNSQFFNAYKIEDFSTYKQNICYYNRNNNETCLDIDFASSYNNSWLEGFGEDNSNFVGGQEQNQSKLDNLFSIIKVPFNFLNSLKNYQCSSITLPIPFTNNSMTLQCLSGKFREVMGENLFNIIYTILTAFYAYRITLMNIDTATDILNPSDDKLEVVDL